MNWEDDPVVQQGRREHAARMTILRTAIIWTPFFVLCLAGLVFFFFDQVIGEERGTWFLIVVLALFTALFGFQSMQALLDLFGRPTERRGTVTRRWSRSDSFVVRSHYIRLDGAILRGDRVMLDGIKAGDEVEARYYRHSGVIVWVHKLAKPRPSEGGGEAQTA